MVPRELPADDFASLAEDRHPWWVPLGGEWHAVGRRRRARCGRSVEEPPYHYQEVLATTTEAVGLCGRCLAELDADDVPDGLGELLVKQFRLSYGE